MNLFAYGTLMWPEILEAVAGRRLEGSPAVLEGYSRFRVKGEPYPVVIPSPKGTVEGVLYQELTPEEFRRLDAFEGVEYNRVEIRLNDRPAFVYVLSEEWRQIVDFRPWIPADQEQEVLARFGGGRQDG